MPKLEEARNERRKAEHDLMLMKARVRLLRDTADHHEKKLQIEDQRSREIDLVKSEAEWTREIVYSEFMKRRTGSTEKKKLVVEQKKLAHENIDYSRRTMAGLKAAAARKVRSDLEYRMDAAFDIKQSDIERRRENLQRSRKHAERLKEMAANSAKEFSVRMGEMKEMAAEEEYTRRFLAKEAAEKAKDSIAHEMDRLLQIRSNTDRALEDLSFLKKSSSIPFTLAEHSFVPRKRQPSVSSYQIAGPGMAVVLKGERTARVHFPISSTDQSAFVFDPGSNGIPLPHHLRGAMRPAALRPY